MKTTVICCINSKYVHSSLAPWYLKSGISQNTKDIQCVVCEGTINEKVESIVSRLLSQSPDIIGFCCYIWNIEYVYQIIDIIKKADENIKIILGGPEVSYNQKNVLENKNVDFVISGEGERPFAKLVASLINNISIDIEGVSYKKGEEFIIKQPFIDEGTPCNPYSAEYFENLKGRIAYIEASRGCPYSCAFCLSGRCGSARYFDFETVKKNILNLAKSGAKTIKFVDRTFNANFKRCNEIISFILKNYGDEIPSNVCFHFEIAGDILQNSTYELLKNSPKGLFQLEIGMQSFNEKTLAYINRKTDTKKLLQNVERLVSLNNMHIHIDLIIGLPFEDMQSFEKSFNKAFKLNSNMLQIGFLKLLYGADMREDFKKYPCVYSKNPPYEILSNQWLSKDKIILLHKFEDTFERIYNSGRFAYSIEYLLSLSDKSPFAFFMDFAQFCSSFEMQNISLDNYQKIFYDYYLKLSCVEKNVLRDKMILDRLSSVNGGFVPEFLRIKDNFLKQAKIYVNNQFALKANTKRAFAILYSENCIAFADYQNEEKPSVNTRFNVNKISISDMKTQKNKE